ncbi:spermidine synthase [Novosphingobium sp. Leaf2]|uniref:spermine/spermidine synthase domain-containing protein n=1 Tax=Novosphingobium sp. Leaf2 TaxID=1735670 RepID=UPI0006F65DA1|nr:spermidine synthase [Novosphingobium sp. Leaf2]KQM13314.1 spermidine synthase [Novosphingobium sp. Leaf2]
MTGNTYASLSEDQLVAVAQVPDGVELRLVRNGDDFAILLDRNELMSTDLYASEEALATLTCSRLIDRVRPQLLIGGYGMGFTLRAALEVLGSEASITVAELVPEIIEWAHGPMRRLTAGCLDDPRVLLVQDDVAMLIDAAREGYDAILLDVDNGPEGLTRRPNDWLYSENGLQSAKAALRPGGILAVWSATPDKVFADLLAKAGFTVEEVPVEARTGDRPGGEDPEHLVWFACKR